MYGNSSVEHLLYHSPAPGSSTKGLMNTKSKIIALGGLTASGKTSLSISIAKKFNGEIINTDSRQVYRELNIGTAKEKVDQRNKDGSVIIAEIKHHLIDIVDPDESFNLAVFQKLALEKVEKILNQKSLPILTGGTGLYIDSIVYGYNLTQEKFDQPYRVKLSKMTVQKLQELLSMKDTKTFTQLNKSDRKNKYRLIRQIEKSLYPSSSEKSQHPPYNYLYLAIKVPIKSLIKNIDERVDSLFDMGLLHENEVLRKKGYTTELSSMKSIGYREFDKYFDGMQTLDETRELIKLHTRQYAKRQITWFKRNKDIVWISGLEEAESAIEKFLD